MGEEKGKKRRERRGEREKGEGNGCGGDGMTTTIGVTFNSGDRGNLKGEEREKELGLKIGRAHV